VDHDVVLVRAKDPLPGALFAMHSAIDSMHTDPANGWGEHTAGSLSMVDIDGDHLTIMEEPRVADLVGAVLRAIDLRASESEKH
jgi:thioesterase domain-containing protein